MYGDGVKRYTYKSSMIYAYKFNLYLYYLKKGGESTRRDPRPARKTDTLRTGFKRSNDELLDLVSM